MTPQAHIPPRPGKYEDTRAARRKAERRGVLAEWLCAFMLMAKGYRLLARRYRCKQGEIDLVAKRGRTLVFVEVKARADEALAAQAISARQQQRISRAASVFLQNHPELAGCDCRFDAMLVGAWAWPRHLTNAWHAGV